ncbi:hypothetical protein [Streptomyces erythrochromogenes]|uniref:hypothetical protein n=1 Tax=Streptomyces erythrochromogenes TaxID=285574 RepID=UPI0036F674C3
MGRLAEPEDGGGDDGPPPAELDARVPEDAAGALSWARHAGFAESTDAPAVEAVLRSHEPFAEELFDTLLDHLGFPPGPGPDPGPDPGGVNAGRR